jgi:hypothetical protein
MKLLMRISFTTILLVSALLSKESWAAPRKKIADEVFKRNGQKQDRIKAHKNERDYSSNKIRGRAFKLDKLITQKVSKNKPEFIKLQIPTRDKLLELDLYRVEIFSPDFKVRMKKGGSPQADLGVHYRGIVSGDASSLSAISFFQEKIEGFVSIGDKNYNIGKIENSADEFIAHDINEIERPKDLNECGQTEALVVPSAQDLTSDGSTTTSTTTSGSSTPMTSGLITKPVRVYFEVANEIYTNKTSNTISYITGLFSQVAIMYANENIEFQLSDLFIWDTTDPYVGLTTTSNRLNAFGSRMATVGFNGNIAALVGSVGGGGVAYVNTLCNSNPSYRTSYSAISFSYLNVPSYSWSVEVLTHEMGHNLGSQHTHSCSWNGDNTAIDGCYTVSGSCPQAALPPAGGGTVMSYCHLNSQVGINFSNGFGPQPGDLIRNRVANATCINSTTSGPDTTAPSVSISNTLLTIDTATSVTINALASDNIGVTKVEFFRDGVLASTDVSSPYSHLWSLSGVPNGSYSWVAKAYDAAGNVTSSIAKVFTVNYIPDTTPPVVAISNTNLSVVSGSPLLISATASDDRALAKVEFYLNNTKMGEKTTSPYDYTWNVSSSGNGIYNWMARAIDSSGNSKDSVVKQFTVNIDTIAPTAPQLSATVVVAKGKTKANLTWTASSDNVGVVNYQIYVNGVLRVGISALSYQLGLSTGTNVITVRAKDQAGNLSPDSNSFTYTVTKR